MCFKPTWEFTNTFFFLDGDPGIIPYLLVKTGKVIKYRSFSGIGISDKGNIYLFWHYSTTSISINSAVSFLMAKWLPFMFRYIGSLNGAVCTNSTSLPGKHPISNSLRGISSWENCLIIPFCPFFNDAMVSFKFYLD